MADTAPSVVTAKIKALIDAISDIGKVLEVAPWHHDDLSERLVTEIDGVDVLRCWWVQGPVVSARWITELGPEHIVRTWTYEIHGLEGLAPAFDGDTREPGGDLTTLRDNAVRVMDALDADQQIGLGNALFNSRPCQITDEPAHIGFADGQVVGSAVVITKELLTIPARD